MPRDTSTRGPVVSALALIIAVVCGDPMTHPAAGQTGPDRPALRDKIFVMLDGSALGDAMGAPSEMWSRDRIQAEYGFMRELHPTLSQPSPEGTWGLNFTPVKSISST